jgi:release factor glutamine methyltransferase
MFANYLVADLGVSNKLIANIGSASFALGIIAAKNGAREAIGTDILPEAIDCGLENARINELTDKARVLLGDTIDPLLPLYRERVDLLVSSPPWDKISIKDFANISKHRQTMSSAFYDREDYFLNSLLSKAPLVLSKKGIILITASKRVLSRFEKIVFSHQMHIKVVKRADLHGDGEIHYILQVYKIPTVRLTTFR